MSARVCVCVQIDWDPQIARHNTLPAPSAALLPSLVLHSLLSQSLPPSQTQPLPPPTTGADSFSPSFPHHPKDTSLPPLKHWHYHLPSPLTITLTQALPFLAIHHCYCLLPPPLTTTLTVASPLYVFNLNWQSPSPRYSTWLLLLLRLQSPPFPVRVSARHSYLQLPVFPNRKFYTF